MCRLFGFRSAVPSRAHRSLLEAENALALQSTQHPDGWGIGWIADDEAHVVKSAHAAHASERFRHASERLRSQTFVVHVRKATVGQVSPLNAHPFRFGRWLFAHNGTVPDFPEIQGWILDRIEPRFRPLVLGDTDSEHLFYYLLTALARAGADATGRSPTSAALAAPVVRAALLELDSAAVDHGIERPLANVLLTDGALFIGHRAGMPLHLSTQKLSCPEVLTCEEPRKACLDSARPADLPVNHLLLASEPIAANENLWEEVPDGATVVLDDAFRLSFIEPPTGWLPPILPAHLRSSTAA